MRRQYAGAGDGFAAWTGGACGLAAAAAGGFLSGSWGTDDCPRLGIGILFLGAAEGCFPFACAKPPDFVEVSELPGSAEDTGFAATTPLPVNSTGLAVAAIAGCP